MTLFTWKLYHQAGAEDMAYQIAFTMLKDPIGFPVSTVLSGEAILEIFLQPKTWAWLSLPSGEIVLSIIKSKSWWCQPTSVLHILSFIKLISKFNYSISLLAGLLRYGKLALGITSSHMKEYSIRTRGPWRSQRTFETVVDTVSSLPTSCKAQFNRKLLSVGYSNIENT